MSKKDVKTSLPTDRTLYKLIQTLRDTVVYPNVVDNLTSDFTDEPLSAKQGKVLDGKISAIDAKIPSTASSSNQLATTDYVQTAIGDAMSGSY